jgi:Flp pilus assembly secretin CpaC
LRRRDLSRDVVSRVGFSLRPPGYPVSWGMGLNGPELISGTDLDGVWHIRGQLLSEHVGTWEVRYVTATDRAGNTTVLEGPALEAMGWDLTFENQP